MQVKISTIVSHVNFEIFKCSKFQFKNIRLTEASEASAQGDSQEVEASAGPLALLHLALKNIFRRKTRDIPLLLHDHEVIQAHHIKTRRGAIRRRSRVDKGSSNLTVREVHRGTGARVRWREKVMHFCETRVGE
jgi:hypothetical protein